MSAEDDAVYAVEDIAFEGTPLADRMDRRSLITETLEVAAHPAIYPFTGDVTVEEATTRLVHKVAYARGQLIRFAPTSTERFVVVHELAHVVHRRSGTGGTSHGAWYRALYVDLTAAVYGTEYGATLRHAFREAGLPVRDTTTIRCPEQPVIPIDVLADVTREVRWL